MWNFIRWNAFPGGAGSTVFPANPEGSAVLVWQHLLLKWILGAEIACSLWEPLHSTFVMTKSPPKLLLKHLKVPSFIGLVLQLLYHLCDSHLNSFPCFQIHTFGPPNQTQLFCCGLGVAPHWGRITSPSLTWYLPSHTLRGHTCPLSCSFALRAHVEAVISADFFSLAQGHVFPRQNLPSYSCNLPSRFPDVSPCIWLY